MPSAAEAAGAQDQLAATQSQGIGILSGEQTVRFQRYTRVALSQDGYVFWVATGAYMTAKGSLHYSTERMQDIDQTIGANQVTLTSEAQISEFNLISPDAMWIGDWPTQEPAPPLKVAFASRGEFYKREEIWHYLGFAVYPALLTQIIDSAADLPAGPIVSNSLPIWLLQTTFAGQTVPAFPSFLVPENIRPPYIAVHIPPEATESLAAAPWVGPPPGQQIPNSGTAPLYSFEVSTPARDTVLLTLYGFSNEMAWNYLQSLYDASYAGTAPFGFANSPVPVDEKRVQVEIAALAQKKTITILANYTMASANAEARRYILSASISSFTFLGGAVPTAQASGFQDVQTGSAMMSVFQ